MNVGMLCSQLYVGQFSFLYWVQSPVIYKGTKASYKYKVCDIYSNNVLLTF
jgi:hypothetical protein